MLEVMKESEIKQLVMANFNNLFQTRGEKLKIFKKSKEGKKNKGIRYFLRKIINGTSKKKRYFLLKIATINLSNISAPKDGLVVEHDLFIQKIYHSHYQTNFLPLVIGDMVLEGVDCL